MYNVNAICIYATLLYMFLLYLHVSKLFTVESKKSNHSSTIICFKLLMMFFTIFIHHYWIRYNGNHKYKISRQSFFNNKNYFIYDWFMNEHIKKMDKWVLLYHTEIFKWVTVMDVLNLNSIGLLAYIKYILWYNWF